MSNWLTPITHAIDSAVVDELFTQHQLCWADIDTEAEEEDEADADADAEPTEPTKYFNEAGEQIPEWEAQLLAQAEEETAE